jgi:5-hydroxyisourate hydrolase-like protein (transthyretin family)
MSERLALMCAVALPSSHLLTARTVMWPRQYTIMLLVLGLVLPFGAAFVLSKVGRLSAEPTLYPVEGKVLVNGEPAENLNVAFHPLAGDKNLFCPVGRTNSKGIFHLTTRAEADGAPAGQYSVTFVWPDGLMDECECPDPSLHDRLKGSYAKADQSTVQVSVGSSGNLFSFNASRPIVHDRLP